MYLARREFDKPLRVYQIDGAERVPRAFVFMPTSLKTPGRTQAAEQADTYGGICATGYSRSEAITNLRAAEEEHVASYLAEVSRE